MRRKLIKQGMGGLTMSIPKKWVDRQGLKAGDEIDILQVEDHLEVSSPRKREKSIKIDLSNADSSRSRTILASAYRRGYDLITLTSRTGFCNLQPIVDSLTGFMLTHQTQETAIIKNIMAEENQNVEAILSKFLLSIHYLLEETGKNTNAKELLELQKNIIRMRDYCQRIIHLTTYKGDKSYEYNLLVFAAEKISGNCKTIFNSKQKNIVSSLQEIADLFNELRSTLIKKDAQKAVTLNKKVSKNLKESYTKKIPGIINVMMENLLTLSARIVGVLL